MDSLALNADRAAPALVHAARLPWQGSPADGVQRRMLERIGAEVALATSIVRYAPGSRFAPHAHALGEEFLVLAGTFSDEHGHYPAGSYVRNPPGSGHAPYSEDGCVIFVKLRQMAPAESRRVVLRPGDIRWQPAGPPAREQALLHTQAGETVTLERLAPGCTMAADPLPGGREILVLEGTVRLADDPQALLEPWSWLRQPGTGHSALETPAGALLWIKTGHLPPPP